MRLWHTASWEAAGALQDHSDQLRSLAISSDGTRLASVGFDGATYIYELPSGALLHRLVDNGAAGTIVGVNSAAFAHTVPELATAGRGGFVWLWNLNDGSLKARLKPSETHLDSIAYSPNDRSIAVCGEDYQVHVWEGDPERVFSPSAHFRMATRVWSVTFRDNDELVATSDDGAVRVWSRLLAPDRTRISLQRPGLHYPRVALTLDGSHAVVLYGGEMFVVDVANASSRVAIAQIEEGITAAAISPDGKTLAVTDAAHQLTFWNVAGWQKGPSWPFPAMNVAKLSFLAGGRFLAVYSHGGAMFYFDVATHAIMKRSTIEGNNAALRQSIVCLGPAAESDGLFHTTDKLDILEAGKSIWRQAGPGPQWKALAWSPDGRRIAACAEDSSVHVWSAVSATPNLSLQPTASSTTWCFLPTGGRLQEQEPMHE